jgi:hypothetical protein
LGMRGRIQSTDAPGSVPHISHLDHRIRSRYLESIPAFRNPDEGLSNEEKAESLAWTAYIEQNLTDLVVRPSEPITSTPNQMGSLLIFRIILSIHYLPTTPHSPRVNSHLSHSPNLTTSLKGSERSINPAWTTSGSGD